MANIKVTMKDGTVYDFRERGRSGGSWHNSVRYEGGVVIIRDEWEKETAFPVTDVKLVEKDGPRSW